MPVTVAVLDTFQAPGLIAKVQVPEPSANVLILVLDELTPPADKVTLYVLAFSVPATSPIAAAAKLLDVNASRNVSEPPGEFMLIAWAKVLPALVIV